MTDDPMVQAALEGLGEPRPLPPGLADDLVALVLDAEPLFAPPGDQLRDLDRPRTLPTSVAQALAGSVLAAVSNPGGGPGRRGERGRRWIGAAAAVLIVAGLVAATTRAVPRAEEVAVRPDEPTFGPWFSPIPPSTSTSVPPAEPPSRVVALAESDPAYARLETFSDCDELLSWVKPRAEWVTNAWGFLPGDRFGQGGGPVAGAPVDDQPSASAAPAPTGHSGTNVQEAGVDEPDGLKVSDGSLLMLTDGALHIIDTSGGGAVLASTTPLQRADAWPRSLLLDGPTAVVLSDGRGDDRNGITQLRFFDVTDRAAPVERPAASLAGVLSDARVIGGVAHIVTGWRPGPFAFVGPSDPQDQSEVDRATDENRRLVRESTLEQWVPPGVPCDRVARPRDLAGFTTTLIWSVPIAHPSATTVRGLIADPGTVYASTDRLVIATQRWEYGKIDDASQPVPPTVRTNLHRFALESGGSRYLSSGSVPGFLWTSYALSEHNGYLRVASTDGPPGTAGSTVSTVTVLQDDGRGLLRPVGSIGGLGVGQVVVGIRFVGDVGYVVTFRRTDPLYTIDLSDPAHPRLRGALEVTGFSGYLHPLADGRLLGVGVEADEQGATTGGALSLYDVSNLDEPRLAQRIVEPSTTFVATGDPHGFLLWEPTGQVVLPAWKGGVVTHEDGTSTYEVSNSFEVFRLDGAGITTQGRIDHGGHGERSEQGAAYRAAMVGGVLYTVSTAGVMASNPTTLDEQGWAAFPLSSAG